MYIGIDIGGTSIKSGIVTKEGKILDKFSLSDYQNEDAFLTIERLINLIKTFINEHNYSLKDFEGIGVGCPGAIDSINKIVDYSNNLNWNNIPLGKLLEEGLNLPVKITNDANAATLAEAKFGVGRKYQNIIMLTLGTGVGGGIIINGKLYEGNMGKGAELGHTIIIKDGYPCTCGRKGCLESYASATALIRLTKEAMQKDEKSLLWDYVNHDIEKVNGKTVWEVEKQNDETAKKVINEYISYLGEGILNFCNIFRPEAIVLSGGIANQKENLTNRLIKYCEDRYYGFHNTPKVNIEIAELVYDTGIIGAASLFIE